MPSHRLLLLVLAATLAAQDAAPTSTTKARFNLPTKPDKPRFVLTDITWPAQPGEAAVCLWFEDKFAAYSVTIDDNCAMDVPWWLEQSKAHGLPLTWFLVTSGINDPKAYKGMTGTWPLWQSVLEQGHEIGSHSVLHWHGFAKDGTPPEGWQGFAWECSESKLQIEAGMPGHQVRVMAYPGGPGQKFNDPDVAIRHYLAIRGGTGINRANQIDYRNVNYMSAPSWNDPKLQRTDPTSILTRDPKSPYFRGWASPLFHFVGKPEFKEKALVALAFYKDHAAELWGGRFGDIARYAQERDTATLAVAENTADRIALDLTDEMDDALYAHPLTVKVRLPAAWTDIQAVQDGKPCAARVVEHEGGRFALLAVVPDRGRCVITAK